MNTHRARHREAERIRQVARRRQRRRRLATVAALTLVLVAGIADLTARLRAIGLPPLSPAEGTAVHIHQHLDLYVDGAKVPVPAGIGIDTAVGFAPLYTHDASGIIHVESPTVRGYTLREFFAVWGVRFTPSCLGGYCAAGARQLRVYVDGRPVHGDPTALTLASH